jgi:diaminopimelate decarboxylase
MDLANGTYHLGGVPITELIEQYGSPLYVYEGEVIRAQYKRLKAAFDHPRFHFKYALKANNNLNILRLLRAEGCGLDAVALPEVLLGLKAGFAPEQILFTPNCVPMEEFEEATRLGVRINIDNIAVLEEFGARHGDKVPVCIRLNPHIVAGGHGNIQTGHIDSKFGISIHQLRHILRVVRSANLRIDGLHMHTGSDILDSDVFLRAADVLFEAAQEFPDLRFLDFGSGFKVAYKDGDIVTDIDELGQSLQERLASFDAQYGRPLDIWFEPGKFIVSESGTLLVKATTVKQTVSTVFVGVDSGLNHLLRPMLYNAYHSIVNTSNPEGKMRLYSVVGYICETDTLGWDRKLHEVREGDILAILNAGAYGYSMSSNYNSRYRPAEVLTLDGQAHLIRQRETMDDLLRNVVEVSDLAK